MASAAPLEAAAAQRKSGVLFAIVSSSSRIAGLLVRATARSIARRVRAAFRRCRQLDVTLLMVVPFIEVVRLHP